jgi:hypothetical protein
LGARRDARDYVCGIPCPQACFAKKFPQYAQFLCALEIRWTGCPDCVAGFAFFADCRIGGAVRFSVHEVTPRMHCREFFADVAAGDRE